jgi:sigma-E factor negative regulatory protein RseA
MGIIMGSVSVQSQKNSQASSRGERLSAFVDGELSGEAHLNTLFSELDHDDRASWSCYHLIGDALRSDDLAVAPATSSAFLAKFSAQLENEPHVLAPSALSAMRRLGVLRRRVVPAFAVAAAAATLTWIVVPQLQGVPGAGGSGAQVAQVSSVSAHGDAMQHVAMTAAVAPAQPVAQEANIIRDASLDQYLEAHQQFGQQPVMPGAPLIRAAMTSQGQ